MRHLPLPGSRRLAGASLLALAAATGPALAEVPRVVTDMPPVQSLVALVMGDLGTPGVLLAQGADPHHYQLRPSQARELQEAQLIFWIGPSMTPWLDRALDGSAGGAQAVALLDAPGTYRRAFAEGEGDDDEDEDGDHDHGHDDHDGHDDHAAADHEHEHGDHDHDHDHEDHADEDHGHHHDHGSTDPHAWLDPANAETWLGVIAAQLSASDPEHAAQYAANAEAARERIAGLDAKLQAELAPLAGKPFVVFHDAYGYFAEHYGLNIAGEISLGDAAAPGAERLAALRQTIAVSGAACIFPEAQHDPKLVESLVADTGAKVGAALDPEGSSLTYGPGLYEAMLQGMADRLVACLGQ